MDIVEQVKQIAVNYWYSALKSAPDQNGTFKMVVSARIGDTTKPLLLVGNAHGKIEDGHCIAVLNPDEALLDRIKAGCAYMPGHLKEIFAKRCDVIVDLFIEAYKNNRVGTITTYRARDMKPAKFAVT